MTTAQVVSLTHQPPLPPGNTPGTHFPNRRIMKAKLNTWAISDFLAPRAYIPLGSASLRWHDAHNKLHKISFVSFKSDPQSATPRCELISMLLSRTERVS